MTILHSIVLGIVEGLTEFLPVSSTAHLLLLSHVLKIPETEFIKSFTIIIQFAAILAVMVLYFKRLFADWETMKRIAVAFIPTAVVGFLFYKLIKGFLFVHSWVSLLMLFVFGVVLIIFERKHIEKNIYTDLRTFPYRTAFLIGLAQAAAVVPGVSRSGATIIAGLVLGFSRSAIVEFSFLLAVPTMAAAAGYDLLKQGASFSGPEVHLLIIGFVTTFIAALIAVKFFLRFVAKNSFEAFGWYRIVIAVVLALLIFH